MENVHFCPHCGAQITDYDKFCPNCGASLADSKEENPKAASYQSAPSQTYYQPYSATGSSGGSPVAGLVFGILSVVLGGWLWSILGIVFSKPQKNTDSKAKAGFILSIIGLAISLLYTILLIVNIVSYVRTGQI